MPITIGAGFERGPEITPGEHILKLVSIRPIVQDNTFFKPDEPESPRNPKQRTRLVWDFMSETVDPSTGKPFEYGHWTNDNYGNSRASLTKLLDMLVPGITEAQAKGMDVERLVGRRYKAFIAMRKNQKNVMVPDLAYATPHTGTADPVAAADPVAQSPMERAAADHFDPDTMSKTTEAPF